MGREIDDIYKRKREKALRLGNRKTITDDYTGKRVKPEKVDTDHTIPIEQVKRAYPNLSTEQQKTLVNRTSNYAYTDRSINRSKGAMSNSEYVDYKLRNGGISFEQAARMLDAQEKASNAMRKEAKQMARDNAKNKIRSYFKKK